MWQTKTEQTYCNAYENKKCKLEKNTKLPLQFVTCSNKNYWKQLRANKQFAMGRNRKWPRIKIMGRASLYIYALGANTICKHPSLCVQKSYSCMQLWVCVNSVAFGYKTLVGHCLGWWSVSTDLYVDVLEEAVSPLCQPLACGFLTSTTPTVIGFGIGCHHSCLLKLYLEHIRSVCIALVRNGTAFSWHPRSAFVVHFHLCVNNLHRMLLAVKSRELVSVLFIAASFNCEHITMCKGADSVMCAISVYLYILKIILSCVLVQTQPKSQWKKRGLTKQTSW